MTAHSPMRLHWLDPRNPREDFPPLAQALPNPNGLLAIGGDLSVSRLLRAYERGIFPWFNPDEPILWWSPDPRCVFQPGALRIHRSLRKTLRRADYQVSLDRAFPAVIEACSQNRRGGTWLGPSLKAAYTELHRRGYAHSVEVWRGDDLIGGLYGVALGRVFFGESMFSRAADGSKIALAWLSAQLHRWDYALVDCQVRSAHLMRLGATDLPREDFAALLQQHIPACVSTGAWRLDADLDPLTEAT